MLSSIGSYRVLHKIGEGGMGTVYAAHDERLDRQVALKLMSAAGDEARQRFWREARAAARVSHPHVCQIYDVGEHDGQPFLAMELLEGEPLDSRLHDQAPLEVELSIDITLEILDALAALHERDVIHRDLKPSNVFLTPRGVKLLDFGLALEIEGGDLRLTQPGTVLGTPQYMAPEQWLGNATQPQTDLFACGALLFEMLSGRPPFTGETAAALFRAVTLEQPPALVGGRDVQRVDSVVRRALEKKPSDRFASAAEMAEALRAVHIDHDATRAIQVRAATRLVVLPFRLLRPGSDVDFLATSLAEEIGASLSEMESLVVRSTRSLGRPIDAEPDLPALAAELEVDVVLFGSILADGDSLRLSTQLVDARSGTLVSSSKVTASTDDVLELQEELTRRVVDSLCPHLLPEDVERATHRQSPGSPRAYELYLRATDLAGGGPTSALTDAAELYRQSLEEDPHFAPGWARLGRVLRVTAKYTVDRPQVVELRRRAEHAFRRALELSPDLSLAHNLFTYFEIEELASAPRALLRLLDRVERHAGDAELFAGLVVACRFCGLLEASLASHERARRLDPLARTSVEYTFWMLGRYDEAMRHEQGDVPYVELYALPMLDRDDQAIALCKKFEKANPPETAKAIVQSVRATLEGDAASCRRNAELILASGFNDAEGLYFVSRHLAKVGENDLALETFEAVLSGNFLCDETARADPWLEGLRGEPRMGEMLAELGARRQRVAREFVEAGGPRLLGLEP